MSLTKLVYAWHDIEDRIFDILFNVVTSGRIPSADLQGNTESKAHATAYQAVWFRNVRKLIGEARRLGFRGTFVDVGCGKGKACFVAALHGFPEVLGIDFDAHLIATAENNKTQFRGPGKNIQFSHGDAAQYLVPERRILIFMFNPFDAVVLESFMRNNAARIRTHGSMIAYANDNQRVVLERTGMRPVFRDAKYKISLWSFPTTNTATALTQS